MASRLRFTGVFTLSLTLGCSLIAPSKDEISGGNAAPSGGSGGSGGATGGSAGSTGGTAGGGAGGTAGATGGSGGSGGAPTLIWSDEFSDFTGDWQYAGDGNWNLVSGEAVQSSPSATAPVRWVPELVSLTNYRIEVSARRTSPSAGALQILFRQTDDSRFYYCSFHPAVGEMFWGMYSDGFNTTDLGPAHSFGTSSYDADDQFTMTLTAVDNHFECSVANVTGASMELDDNTYPTGAPGLKTYVLPGAYDYIRVYDK
jgi:hypothetical protein